MNISLKKGMTREEVNSIFIKNKIAIIFMDDIYNGNDYKHNWRCSCGSTFKRTFSKIKDRDSIECKECRYRKVEQRYKELVEKDGEYLYIRSFRKGDELPDGRIVGDAPYIQIKHIHCGKILTITAAGFINQNKRCRCAPYEKSIEFLSPKISKQIYKDKNGKIVNEEDKKSIHAMSLKQYYFKCEECGKVSKKCICLSSVYRNGRYSCEFCSDGISLPERFMANLLLSLNIDFKKHISFKWSQNVKRGNNKKLYGNKYYDFYIKELNIIIETHGIQHFEEIPRGRSLKEEQDNDKIKKEIAIEQIGEKNYITIDCRKSEFEWLKQNFINALNNNYFSKKIDSLKNVDWDYIWLKSQESLVVKSWRLFNEGYSVKEIAEQMKLCTVTIRKYLKRGALINKCSYDSEKEKNKQKRKIICVTTGKFFDSIIEAAQEYNFTLKDLWRCCNSKNKIYGRVNGKPLVWMYYDEYLKLSEYEKENLRNVKYGIRNMIICITTGKTFTSFSKAAEKYGVDRKLISACCKHKEQYEGILEDGTKLVWMYYDEYLEKNIGLLNKVENIDINV